MHTFIHIYRCVRVCVRQRSTCRMAVEKLFYHLVLTSMYKDTLFDYSDITSKQTRQLHLYKMKHRKMTTTTTTNTSGSIHINHRFKCKIASNVCTFHFRKVYKHSYIQSKAHFIGYSFCHWL